MDNTPSIIKPKKPRKKSFMENVAEMIGKIAPINNWMLKTSVTWDLYSASPSVDYSQVNYTLTRAIFYASKVTDNVSGKTYGGSYLFGAVFGKPIVNSAAAFAFAKMPEITVNKDQDKEKSKTVSLENKKGDLDYTENYINKWFDKNESDIFKLCRNSLRDGDQYILIREDATPSLIPPEQVEIIDDPLTGDILGYDIKVYVTEAGGEKGEVKVKYITKYRKTSPYRQVWKYDTENEKNGILVEEDVASDDEIKVSKVEGEEDEITILEKPLPIQGFHNERDSRERYGNSEYQNCYYLMANYHAVLEGAIKNNIYNSTSTPIVKGITDPKKWLTANGYVDSNGNTKVKWDGSKMLVGGKEFDMKFVTGAQNAGEAQTILEILFWLICQTSETPEFVMGTAVASSNASVDSQMPVVIRKANRKRTEYKPFFRNLINLVLYKARQIDPEISSNTEFEVVFPEILDDDLNVNINVVKTLSEEGCITDKTKMILLNMGKYVTDLENEIELAHKEITEKSENVKSEYGINSDQSNQKEEENIEKP